MILYHVSSLLSISSLLISSGSVISFISSSTWRVNASQFTFFRFGVGGMVDVIASAVRDVWIGTWSDVVSGLGLVTILYMARLFASMMSGVVLAVLLR